MSVAGNSKDAIDRAVDLYLASIGRLEEFENLEPYEDDDELQHYGTPRHSGRYPWGSGENPYQRTDMFGSFEDKVVEAVFGGQPGVSRHPGSGKAEYNDNNLYVRFCCNDADAGL